jgi:hypothetical protein
LGKENINKGAEEMRFIINGKKYRLRENVKIRIQGIELLVLGFLCYKTDADGAAVFMWFLGTLMTFGTVDSKR